VLAGEKAPAQAQPGKANGKERERNGLRHAATTALAGRVGGVQLTEIEDYLNWS